MSSNPWPDFVAALSEDLRSSRRAFEDGGIAPPSPPHPLEPMPADIRDQVHRLAVAYEQLALEVATRLADIGAQLHRTRAKARPLPRFVDQKV